MMLRCDVCELKRAEAVRFKLYPNLTRRPEEGWSVCPTWLSRIRSQHTARVLRKRDGRQSANTAKRCDAVPSCVRPRGPLRHGLRHRVASLSHNPLRARLCFSADKHWGDPLWAEERAVQPHRISCPCCRARISAGHQPQAQPQAVRGAIPASYNTRRRSSAGTL